jgi:hypothetical protein
MKIFLITQIYFKSSFLKDLFLISQVSYLYFKQTWFQSVFVKTNVVSNLFNLLLYFPMFSKQTEIKNLMFMSYLGSGKVCQARHAHKDNYLYAWGL